MATNPQSSDDQKNLNERLRSLKIDRAPAPSAGNKNRAPKLLLLGIATLIALAAYVGKTRLIDNTILNKVKKKDGAGPQ